MMAGQGVPRRYRWSLVLILLGYLAVTVGYGLYNPLFESPDEHWHFFTADYIATNGRLPIVEPATSDWLGQEAAQPPLYYLLGALLIAPIDTAGATDSLWLNPYAWIGNADALANVNRMVHTPAEAWPWDGYALAAHLLRAFSTLLGLGTLLAIYGSGRLLWPDDPIKPLLATGLVAFLPQFNFIHASVTNDALITFLAAAGLYQLIVLWTRPDSSRLWARLLAVGITTGLAALTKNAGILLLLYSLGFLLVLAVRTGGGLRRFLPAAAAVAGPALLIAGWLWLRNASLYGDFTATNQFIAIAGGDRGYTLGQVLAEWPGLILSLVGVFGWFNLQPPAWVYGVWAALALVAAAGALGCVLARRAAPAAESPTTTPSPGTLTRLANAPWMLPLLLAGWVLAVYAGLVTFMLQTEAAQGRLLFPAILPLALGMAWGLAGSRACAARGLQSAVRHVWSLPILLALVTTLFCLLYVVRPAYAAPATVAALPEEAVPVLPELRDRGEGLDLLGARIHTDRAEPGDVIWLTLYWQAADPPPLPGPPIPEAPGLAPEAVLEVFGQDEVRIANLHSYHGRGLYPASLWAPGAIIADRFALRLDPDTQTPVLGRVFARLAEGSPGIEVATIKVVPERWPGPPETTLALFGEHIALASLTLTPETAYPGDTVTAQVVWYVPLGQPGQDYTTLVHLGQPDEPPIVTGDRPPLGGAYPTGAWANGETISDAYQLDLPPDLLPGRYPVWIGLYDPATGERLPVTVEGDTQPNNVYLAGWVEVVPCPAGASCGG
jgi:hypothetical protein